MKTINKVLIVLLSMMITLITTGCSVKDYDGKILKEAATVTTELGFDSKEENPFATGTRYFEVTKTEEGYLVDVNGTEKRIQVPEHHQAAYSPKEIADVTAKHQKIVISSKKLIYQYIDASKILKNKDDIKKYIDKIAVKEAYYTPDNNVGAFYSHADNTLYINKNASDAVSEWMITHELVHAMDFFTHDMDIDKETYAFNMFNEYITDIITAAMEPSLPNEVYSGYSFFYDLVYPYINIMGEEAIEAYFYGYDKVYQKLGKNEFDFFVLVIENYGLENSIAYYNNLILRWYAMI